MSAHRIVYKYSSERGLAILENLELKITPPNEFNDPFEFTPRMICSNAAARAVGIVRNPTHMKNLYKMLKAEGRTLKNFDEFKRYVKWQGHKMAREIAQYMPLAAAETRKELLDKASKIHGLLCLSSRADSILMWGHYCDRHQGMVVGFDSSKPIFNGLKPVKYVAERVVFDASWSETDPAIKVFEDDAVFSKNQDWRYESEYRQLFTLSKIDKRPGDKGTVFYFLKLPADAIVSVLIGTRSSSNFESKVRTVLNRPHFSHVELRRAALHETKFELSFERI